MMHNFRSVWPFRVTYPRVTFAHKVFAAMIFLPLLIPAVVVCAGSALSSSNRAPKHLKTKEN